MNFRNMPELGFTYGYPLALAAMLLSALVLWLVFRRVGWLGAPSGVPSRAAERDDD
jgi:magnesium transporter